MTQLSELAYEDLENLPEATKDCIDRLFEWHVQEGVEAFTDIDSVLYPYLNSLTAIQLEFWIRSTRNDVNTNHHSLIYQNPRRGYLTSDRRDIADDLNGPSDGLNRGWRSVENNVFIDVRETMQDCERVLKGVGVGVPALRIRALVRLERLNDSDVPVAGTVQTVFGCVGPFTRDRHDRKLRLLLMVPPVSEHDYLVGEVVEGGAGVVREVAEHETPLAGRSFEESCFEQVLLRRTRLVLAKDLIGVVHEPGVNLPTQRVRIRLCPVQLEPEPVQRVVRRGDDPTLGHGEVSP